MSKFKVGDKVVYLGGSETMAGFKRGQQVEIERIEETHLLWHNKIKVSRGLFIGFVGAKHIKPVNKTLSELETWHKEFPHLKQYIKEVMKNE